MRKARPLRASAVSCVLFLLAACAPSAAPNPPPTAAAGQPTTAAGPAMLHYAVVGVSWASVPDIVAQDRGFYAAENLNVETVVAGQSAAACQQVLAKGRRDRRLFDQRHDPGGGSQ